MLQLVSRNGRKYLLYGFGSTKDDVEDEESMGARPCLDDVWSLQLKPRSTTLESVRDVFRKVVRGEAREEQWKRITIQDPKGEAPQGLSGMASAMADKKRIVLSGGKTGEGQVCGDIWILTIS